MAQLFELGDGSPAPVLSEWLNKKNALIAISAAFIVLATIQLCNALGMMANAQSGGLH